MKCAGCSKEFEEQEMAYATVTGNIERNFLLNNAFGFYMDLKPWESVLCKDCGLAVHDFIANQLPRTLIQEHQKIVGKAK